MFIAQRSLNVNSKTNSWLWCNVERRFSYVWMLLLQTIYSRRRRQCLQCRRNLRENKILPPSSLISVFTNKYWLQELSVSRIGFHKSKYWPFLAISIENDGVIWKVPSGALMLMQSKCVESSDVKLRGPYQNVPFN